jgi:hypothetical protein
MRISIIVTNVRNGCQGKQAATCKKLGHSKLISLTSRLKFLYVKENIKAQPFADLKNWACWNTVCV